MDKQELIKKSIPYIKWTVISLVAVILMFIYEKPFEAEGAKEVVGRISDCFAVPGVVLSGIGALSYFSSIGAYDSLSYMFSNFSLHSLIPGHHKKKYQTLYEYKQEKDEKGRKWLPNTLKVGLVTLGIGAILLIIYAFL